MRYKRKSSTKIFDTSGEPDKTLLGIISALILFGLLMVYSSSFIIVDDNPFHFLFRQIIYLIIGLTAGFFAYIIDYKLLAKLIIPGLLFSIILLLVVLIPGVGKEINGARRWIDLGFFDLQPSELAKLSFVVYLAAWASNQKKKGVKWGDTEALKEHFYTQLLPFVSILGLVCGLVLLEPDLATTGIIGMTALGVYFLSGRDFIHNMGTIFILVIMVLSGITAGLLAPYRFRRINTQVHFLTTGEIADPRGSGYQLRNILIAVGSGGVTGVGFGESRQKYHYLGNTAFSDNIFAVIAEEFGLIGSIILTSIYFYFIQKGLTVAENVQDRFGQLLASGVTIWIGLQAFLHIGANLGLIPVTGIPLPFISYGGSSMITVLIAAAILLNISKHSRKNFIKSG